MLLDMVSRGRWGGAANVGGAGEKRRVSPEKLESSVGKAPSMEAWCPACSLGNVFSKLPNSCLWSPMLLTLAGADGLQDFLASRFTPLH